MTAPVTQRRKGTSASDALAGRLHPISRPKLLAEVIPAISLEVAPYPLHRLHSQSTTWVSNHCPFHAVLQSRLRSRS